MSTPELPIDRQERSSSASTVSRPLSVRQRVSGVFTVSTDRKKAVLDDIIAGSTPNFIYYVLLGLSELIAGFGLLVDSATTLIGANVVAPLMTPIFGISLGLSRGDLRLLRQAVVAEFGGAALGVLLVFCLGALPLPLQETPLLLAQTEPTLIDLFVAALAGLAGCLAMIDERVSPALPGVAIATALNPPLAAMGLCLASGAYEGAWGAFLLFLANFLAILAVSTLVFLFAGFVTRAEIGAVRGFLRRFAVAGAGLIVITVLLTHSFLTIIQDWRLRKAITTVLEAELADEPTTTIDRTTYDQRDGWLDVMSTLRTPRVLSPQKVKRIEETLTQRLGEKVHLFFRCSITKDVASTGTTGLLADRNLNGEFTKASLTPDAQILQLAEQVVREMLLDIPNVVLDNVELVKLPSGPVIVVSIQSPRVPLPSRVRQAEERLQERLDDPHLRLVVRTIDSVDVSSKGRVLLGHAHFGASTGEEAAEQTTIEQAAKKEIEKLPSLFVTSIDAVKHEQGWMVRAEVVGPRVPSPQEVQTIEKTLASAVKQPVELTVWARTDVIVTGQRYSSVDGYREAAAAQQAPPAEPQAISDEAVDTAP